MVACVRQMQWSTELDQSLQLEEAREQLKEALEQLRSYDNEEADGGSSS